MKQEWLKCDMHMHSQYSKGKDGSRVKEMTAKEYVDTLLAQDVKIFSITDHNCYSNFYYTEIKEYIKDKKIKVINGVELDVYVDVANNLYFQTGVYFDNNVDGEELEKTIFDLYDDNQPTFPDILNAVSKLNCKFIIIPEGDKSRGISNIIKKIPIEEAKEIKKYAMYKVFSAYDVKEIFNTESKNIWAKNFYDSSVSFNKIIENKSTEEIDFISEEIYKKIKDNSHNFNSEEIATIYEYVVKYGSYFAYFSFSDWHNAEEYTPSKNNFIFGSLDLYFEAFELSVLDPLSRIIRTNEYDIPIPSSILKEVKFKLGDKDQQIKFSPGLNVVIGKRGSGKSLLLAIIETLYNKDNDLIKKYKELEIEDIEGGDYNDISIATGQLSSLAVLRQDQISNIYLNPDLANEYITQNFPDIENYDTTYLKKIIESAKKIKPYNKNYKNITSILTTLKELDYFLFSLHSDLKYEGIILKYQTLLENIEDIITELDNFGLNTTDLLNKKKELEEFRNKHESMLKMYQDIIEKNNARIKTLLIKRSAAQKVIQEQRNSLSNILSNINKNFEILLNFNKTNFLLDNAKFDNPKIKKQKKDKYLFVTSYSIPEKLIDEIWTNLTSPISKTKSDSSDIELIRKYIEGEKNLKINYNDLSSDLEKYISSDIFKPKKAFYKISLPFDLNELVTYEDVIENINNGNLEDLSKASPGTKSVAYLDMLFDLNEAILLFDQPEDNIDNDYISNTLVSIIKDKKKSKQLIFVTHNPTLAVYGDAFNYIYVENKDEITYKNYFIEKVEDKENIINILEGGRKSFVNRDKKYGNILGEEEYGNN